MIPEARDSFIDANHSKLEGVSRTKGNAAPCGPPVVLHAGSIDHGVQKRSMINLNFLKKTLALHPRQLKGEQV